MARNSNRKPIKNFMIKRSLQTKIVGQILLFVFLTSIISTLLFAWIYNVKSQAGHFYYMSNDIMHDLELSSILGVVLPSLIGAQLIGFVIASLVGLFSSRKIAVPVYKIEKWAEQLSKGSLRARLAFREQDSMRELTQKCNGVAEFYSGIFTELRTAIQTLENTGSTPQTAEQIKSIRTLLDKVEIS